MVMSVESSNYFLLRYSHTEINLVFSIKNKDNINMMSDSLQLL